MDSTDSKHSARPMRVMLVDDNRLLLEGLTNMLTAYGIEVLGTAADGLEAVRLAESLRPDLILMDIAMPHCDGLEATRRIKARIPQIKIVILTASEEEKDLFESIKSGASGYLIKTMSGRLLVEALYGLQEGIPPFSPGLAAQMLSEFARLAVSEEKRKKQQKNGMSGNENAQDTQKSPLTERQKEVLRLVASGLTYKEVGKRLALSERTVRYHLAEIMERLHLETRSQLIYYAGKRDFEPLEGN